MSHGSTLSFDLSDEFLRVVGWWRRTILWNRGRLHWRQIKMSRLRVFIITQQLHSY